MSQTTVTSCAYDRGRLRPRVLHLGFGAFGRALPLWALDRGLEASGGDFGVIAARLNSGVEALDALDAAQGRFHLAQADGARADLREIGCVIGTCHPLRDGPDALPDLIADPGLVAVILTITEKGYGQRNGRLDHDRADIAADLAGSAPPKTALGVLTEGLARRRRAGHGGLTLLSCDNIPDNGALLAQLLDDMARGRDPALADWIAQNVACPASMVDRITPAMDGDAHALIRAALGREDPAAIVTEPFAQWVLEDRFAAARPPFDTGGAMLVADVTPFERMKLRMLNGAHSFLAHAGRLAGAETVAEAMAQPALRAATQALMAEASATLTMPPGTDLDAYADALTARFDNTRLRHRLDQIAQDTSQKIPQRLFEPAQAHLRAGRAAPLTMLAIASWIVALRDLDAVPDPQGPALRAAACSADPVGAVLALDALGTDLARLQDPVRAAYDHITARGILTALKEAR